MPTSHPDRIDVPPPTGHSGDTYTTSTLPSAAPAYDVQPVVVGQSLATTNTAGKPEGGDQPQYVQPQAVPAQYGGGAHVIHVPQAVVVDRRYDDEACMLGCAQVSCILSIFFPIVGCIAFCFNMDAADGSERKKWAWRCLISAGVSFVLVFIIIIIHVATMSAVAARHSSDY
ncbi:unnamed protein product [Vitrella brassicaformis CCMP3155]|uniref:Transmembrane protein n=1 Tax=Vitrella brassicaformis (strain CCMP3155) TaxID=1169540 RepID=A0A0G4GG71_VITBC|nr:unnamed protein product [Vitrella brassicaformis CCMP3155]|eukprot:CEM28365.1 unnamed protein product [Vitrella brassicaformis CCMP3155]